MQGAQPVGRPMLGENGGGGRRSYNRGASGLEDWRTHGPGTHAGGHEDGASQMTTNGATTPPAVPHQFSQNRRGARLRDGSRIERSVALHTASHDTDGDTLVDHVNVVLGDDGQGTGQPGGLDYGGSTARTVSYGGYSRRGPALQDDDAESSDNHEPSTPPQNRISFLSLTM